MPEKPQNATAESILINNEATAYKVEPEPETESQIANVDETAVLPEAEAAEPASGQEPEVVDEVAEKAQEPTESESDQVEPTEDEDGGEYTQAEWDALPEADREKINAEFEASQVSEADRLAKVEEQTSALKKQQLDFEKQKFEWEKQAAESKKEADKDYQRKMELLADEAKQAGIDKEFKLRKKTERDKPAVDSGGLKFPEYQPKQLVTQQEVKAQRLNQGAIDQLNQQRNDAAKVKYDRMADHFNSQTEFVNEIRAERVEKAAFNQRAVDWGASIKEASTELGFELFSQDGKATPEVDQMYGELYKIGVLDQNDTTPEYRANMVRLIRNSVTASPNGSTNGTAITVPKLSKAPPGQTLRDSSKKIPRRKRPPNTMGGRGTGSKEVQTKRLEHKDILAGNR